MRSIKMVAAIALESISFGITMSDSYKFFSLMRAWKFLQCRPWSVVALGMCKVTGAPHFWGAPIWHIARRKNLIVKNYSKLWQKVYALVLSVITHEPPPSRCTCFKCYYTYPPFQDNISFNFKSDLKTDNKNLQVLTTFVFACYS